MDYTTTRRKRKHKPCTGLYDGARAKQDERQKRETVKAVILLILMAGLFLLGCRI